MNTICEMLVRDFFKLSVGHVALIGSIFPEINILIPASKADLYIEGDKIKTINIIGEDRFFGGDEEVRRGVRSVRTNDDIFLELSMKKNSLIKLVIYVENNK